MQPYEISLDFETASKADLKRVGTARYARDPSTRVLCYSVKDHDTGAVRGDRIMPELGVDRLLVPCWASDAAQGRCIIHAYNAPFEWWMLNEVCTRMGWPKIPVTAMRCTLARARYWGYSGTLDETSKVFGGPPKDMQGHKLMLKLSKPRRATTKRDESWWFEDDPSLLIPLHDYCDDDVEAEHFIASKLPPLPEFEQRVFELDLRMNAAGLRVDTALVDELRNATVREKHRQDARVERATGTAVTKTTQVARLTSWVSEALGEEIEGLDKEALSGLLARDDLAPSTRHALDARRIASKSSTAKLGKVMEALGPGDDRVRGLLQYYGAARTGRWAGRIVQPQNLPRGAVKGPISAADQIVLGMTTPEDVAKESGSDVMTVASGLIRTCLIPDDYEDGGVFLAPDYGQIEARVIAWLAGQDDILEVFARGDDVYTYTAKNIGSDSRQLGKVSVLGLGFGMGPGAFIDAAKVMGGLELDPSFAESTVYAWREANEHIVSFWYELEDAAWRVLGHRGRLGSIPVGASRVHVERARNKIDGSSVDMHIVLPSGRRLVYPRLRRAPHPSHKRESLCYDGLNPVTGKFSNVFTYSGKLAENVTQAVARDVMALALVRLEDWGRLGTPRLTVHDEAILNVSGADVRAGRLDALAREVESVMLFEGNTPAWVQGLPLKVEADVKRRYAK